MGNRLLATASLVGVILAAVVGVGVVAVSAQAHAAQFATVGSAVVASVAAVVGAFVSRYSVWKAERQVAISTETAREALAKVYQLIVVWESESEDSKSGHMSFLDDAQLHMLMILPKGVAYNLQQVSSVSLVPPKDAQEALRQLSAHDLVEVTRDSKTEEPYYTKKFNVERMQVAD